MFRTLAVIFVFVLLPASAWAAKTVQVRGYHRKDGTYVRPHTRSAPSSHGSFTTPAFVPPPVVPRTKYRSSASTTARTFARPLNTSADGSSNVNKTSNLDNLWPATSKSKEPSSPNDGFRIFQDASGKFKVRARFITVDDENAVLRREDNKIITVPLVKLSDTDREWIAERLKQSKQNR